MELIEKAISEKGKVLPGNVLKVGSFLNNRIDVCLVNALGKDISEHFKGKGVNLILTIEASGIAIASLTAVHFNCDVIFAKKSKTSNVEGEYYTAPCYSYTHKVQNDLIVPKEYLSKGDRVLIVDDVLARGEAVNACMSLISQAGAECVGVAVAFEKGFQKAGDALRSKGVDVYAGAIVDEMNENKITFRKQ